MISHFNKRCLIDKKCCCFEGGLLLQNTGNTVKSIFQSFDAGLHTIEKFILSWSIITITFLTVGNVIYRMATGHSWHFSAELSQLALTAATFMGISYAARKGRHISMSAFFDISPKRMKKTLAIVNPLLTAAVMFYLAYYAGVYTYENYQTGETTSALRFPYWIMVIALPLGMFLGGLQFLRNAWVNISHKEVYIAQEKKDYDEQ